MIEILNRKSNYIYLCVCMCPWICLVGTAAKVIKTSQNDIVSTTDTVISVTFFFLCSCNVIIFCFMLKTDEQEKERKAERVRDRE